MTSNLILTTVPSRFSRLTLHGLEYLLSAAKKAGFDQSEILHPEIVGVDAVEDLAALISQKTANLPKATVGLSIPLETLKDSRKLVQILQKQGKYTIIAGGLFPTAVGRGLFTYFPEVDFSVLGYGEKALFDIMTHGKSETLDNVITNTGNGELIAGPRRYTGFGGIYMPTRQNFTFEVEGYTNTTINFTRECAGHCGFCIKDLFVLDGRKGTIFDIKPASLIAEELAELRSKEVEVISAIDHDALGTDASVWPQILDQTPDSGMKLYIETRVENVANNPEIIKRMKNFGLRHVFMGVESVVGSQLERLIKLQFGYRNQSPEEYIQATMKAISVLRENKIIFTLGAIAIDSETTLEEYQAYLKWIEDTGMFEYFSDFTKPVYIYPGTVLHQKYKSRGWLKESAADSYRIGYFFQNPKIEKLVECFNYWRELTGTEERKEFQHSSWYKAILDDRNQTIRIQETDKAIKYLALIMAKQVVRMLDKPVSEIMKIIEQYAEQTLQTIDESGIRFHAARYPKHT